MFLKTEDYLYSSARNYADLNGIVSMVFETRKLISY
jgi:hypothetical protein